jgi:hypothetical protein
MDTPTAEIFSCLPAAVTVSDSEGMFIDIHPAAEMLLAEDNGRTLLDLNLLDCNPPEAQEKIHAPEFHIQVILRFPSVLVESKSY